MHKFSDFAKSEAPLGEKMKITEIFNKDIVVTSYRMLTSKRDGKPLLHLQFTIDGEQRTTFTNSTVLIKQCHEYEKEMPFSTQIAKVGSYYTFT